MDTLGLKSINKINELIDNKFVNNVKEHIKEKEKFDENNNTTDEINEEETSIELPNDVQEKVNTSYENQVQSISRQEELAYLKTNQNYDKQLAEINLREQQAKQKVRDDYWLAQVKLDPRSKDFHIQGGNLAWEAMHKQNVEIPRYFQNQRDLLAQGKQYDLNAITATSNKLLEFVNRDIENLEDDYSKSLKNYIDVTKPYYELAYRHKEIADNFSQSLAAQNIWEVNQNIGNFFGVLPILRSTGHIADNIIDLIAGVSDKLINGGRLSIKQHKYITDWLNSYGVGVSPDDLYSSDLSIWDKLSIPYLYTKFAESVPDMAFTYYGINKLTQIERNAIIAERAKIKAGEINSSILKSIDNQIKAAPKDSAQLKGLLRLKNGIQKLQANGVPTKEFGRALGSLANNYKAASFMGRLRYGDIPFTALMIDYTRRLADLTSSRPDGKFQIADLASAAIHMGVDYASFATVMNAPKMKEKSLQELLEVQSSPKNSLTKIGNILETTGGMITSIGTEGFGEIIQTYIEQQARNNYTLPSLSTIMLTNSQFGAFKQEKNQLEEAGVVAGILGGAMSGGFSLTNKASKLKLPEIPKLKEQDLETLATQQANEQFNYSDEIKQSEEKLEKHTQKIINGLTRNNKSQEEAEQSASEFTQKQRETFETLNNANKEIEKIEEEAKKEESKIESIANIAPHTSQENKIRIAENRKADLLAKQSQKQLTQEEVNELAVLDNYIDNLQIANTQYKANSVVTALLDEVLSDSSIFTETTQQDLQDILSAKNAEEYKDALKKFISNHSEQLASLGKDSQSVVNTLDKYLKDKDSNAKTDSSEFGDANTNDKNSETNTITRNKNNQSNSSNIPPIPNQQQSSTQDNQQDNTQQQNTAQNTTTQEEQVTEENKALNDIELAAKRLENANPEVAMQAIIETAIRTKHEGENYENKQWNDFRRRHTIIRINRDTIRDTGNVRDIVTDNFLEEDNVEVFYVTNQILDDKTNQPIGYLTNTTTKNKLNSAIDNVVHMEKEDIKNRIDNIINLLSNENYNKEEVTKKINDLNQYTLNKLKEIADDINLLNYIILTSGRNSKLAQDLMRIKDALRKRIQANELEIKRIEKLFKDSKNISKVRTDSRTFEATISNIKNVSNRVFTKLKNKINNYQSQPNNVEEKNKLLNIIERIGTFLEKIVSFRNSEEYKIAYQAVINGLSNEMDYLLSSNLEALTLDTTLNGEQTFRFKGIMSVLNPFFSEFLSNFYNIRPGLDATNIIINNILNANDKNHTILLRGLKPLLDKINIQLDLKQTVQESISQGTQGSINIIQKTISLGDLLFPNAENIKNIFTDSQLANLGIKLDENSVSFNNQVVEHIDDIKAEIRGILNESKNKRRLKALLSSNPISESLEQFLHLGLLLQTKVLVEGERITYTEDDNSRIIINPNVANIINGRARMFFEDNELLGNSINEIASLSLALANIYTMNKSYKKSGRSILELQKTDNKWQLNFDSEFIKEFTDEYKEDLDSLFNMLDNDVLESNDKSEIDNVKRTIERLQSSTRKAQIRFMQATSNKIDSISLDNFADTMGIAKDKIVEWFTNPQDSGVVVKSDSDYQNMIASFRARTNIKDKKDFIDKSNPEDLFFNYFRIARYRKKEDKNGQIAIEKYYEFIYIPGLDLRANKRFQKQIDDNFNIYELCTNGNSLVSKISEIQSRNDMIGDILLKLANMQANIEVKNRTRQTTPNEVKIYQANGKEIDFSQDIYYLYDMQSNGRLSTKSSNSFMGNTILRDISIFNQPDFMLDSNGKPKLDKNGNLVINKNKLNWLGKPIPNARDLIYDNAKGNSDLMSQRTSLFYAFIRSLGVDIDKVTLTEESIRNLDVNQAEFEKAIKEYKSGKPNKLSNLLKKYPNILKQTYYLEDKDGNKEDLGNLLDGILRNDKNAIKRYRELVTFVNSKIHSFKNDHPTFNIRAQNQFNKALTNDNFDITQIDLTQIPLYADGSATFMFENSIKLRVPELAAKLARVDKAKTIKDLDKVLNPIVSLFESHYTNNIYKERFNKLLERIPNIEVREHLQRIINDKGLDPHTLALVTTAVTLNEFGDSSLLTSIITNSDILSRDSIKTLVTPASYQAGFHAILMKAVDITNLNTEMEMSELFTELVDDTNNKNIITRLVKENLTNEDREGLEIELCNNFLSLLDNKINTLNNQIADEDKKSNKDKALIKSLKSKRLLLDSFKKYYYNVDKVRNLFFATKYEVKHYIDIKEQTLNDNTNIDEKTRKEQEEKLETERLKAASNRIVRYALFKPFASDKQEIDYEFLSTKLTDILSEDVNKIFRYFTNFGLLSEGKLTTEAVNNANNIIEITSKNNKLKMFFRQYLEESFFDRIKIENNIHSNSNFTIVYSSNANNELSFDITIHSDSNLQKSIDKFQSDYDIKLSETDIKELKQIIINTYNFKSMTNEFLPISTPMELTSMPLLISPRQSSKYFNDVTHIIGNKLTRTIQNISFLAIKKFFESKNINDISTLSDEQLKRYLEIYNKEIDKAVKQSVKAFLDKYFTNEFAPDGVYLTIFSKKPTEEQRIAYMTRQKEAVKEYTEKMNINGILDRYINYSIEKNSINANIEVTVLGNVKDIFPDVNALFNHPFEALFVGNMTGINGQIFDAFLGTANNMNNLLTKWEEAANTSRHEFDNGYVLKKWFNAIDKAVSEINLNEIHTIVDLKELKLQELEEELDLLTNVIRHYVSLTEFFTSNSRNIKDYLHETYNKTDKQNKLYKDFKEALIRYKQIVDTLNNNYDEDGKMIIQKHKRDVSLDITNKPDFNPLTTISKIDNKEQTLIEYLDGKIYNGYMNDQVIDTIIDTFGQTFLGRTNKILENTMNIQTKNSIDNNPSNAIEAIKSLFTTLKNKLFKSFTFKVIKEDKQTKIITLTNTNNLLEMKVNVDTLKNNKNIIDNITDSIIEQFKKIDKYKDTFNDDEVVKGIKSLVHNQINKDTSIVDIVDIVINKILHKLEPNEALNDIEKQEFNNENFTLSKIRQSGGIIIDSSKNKILFDLNTILENEFNIYQDIANNTNFNLLFPNEFSNIRTTLIKQIENAKNKNQELVFVNPRSVNNTSSVLHNAKIQNIFDNKNIYSSITKDNQDNSINSLMYTILGQTPHKPSNTRNKLPNQKDVDTNASYEEKTLDKFMKDIHNDLDQAFAPYSNNPKMVEYVNNLKEALSDLIRNARTGLRVFYFQNAGTQGGKFFQNKDGDIIHIYDNNNTTKAHEFLHAVTDYAFNSNSNEAQILKAKILAINEQIKNDTELRDLLGINSSYLFSHDNIGNIAETIATLLTEPTAVNKLLDTKVKVPYVTGDGKTRFGELIMAIPALIKYITRLATNKIKREPSSIIELLFKSTVELSKYNTTEGELKARTEYDSKLIPRVNEALRKIGTKVVNHFLGKTETFLNMNEAEQQKYREDIMKDLNKVLHTSDLVRTGYEARNLSKGNKVTRSIKMALWLLKTTYYKNKEILPFLSDPIKRQLVRETIADLRQRFIQDTIFDTKLLLDLGIHSTNFLKTHINLINRATANRTNVNYEIESAKAETKQTINAYILATENLQNMLKDEKDLKLYKKAISKLVFHHNLGDYFINDSTDEIIRTNELKELVFEMLNIRSQNIRDRVNNKVNVKLNIALSNLGVKNGVQANAIKKIVTDLAYTRYSDKLNVLGTSNIEMALKQLGIKFNVANNKEALVNLHQAITLKSMVLPYEMNDENSKYMRDESKFILDKYIEANETNNTQLSDDIQKSLELIVRFHGYKVRELYKQKVLDSKLQETRDFYKNKKTDRLYFMEEHDLYHTTNALDRFSESAHYLESFKPYAYNNDRMIIELDPENLSNQFSTMEQARSYYEKLGFVKTQINDRGIETWTHNKVIADYTGSRETPSFIFRNLDHKGQVFKTLTEQETKDLKEVINPQQQEIMKQNIEEYGKDYTEGYIPNVNATYGMPNTKSFAGSETMLRENISNKEFEKLTNVDTSIDIMFEQMEKYIQENNIRDFTNNQIYYQIILGNEEIQKTRQGSFSKRDLYHHTEVLFEVDGDKLSFNKDLIKKYGFNLTSQDEADFARLFRLTHNGTLGSNKNIYIDTRLLPVVFGFNKFDLGESVKDYPLAYRAAKGFQRVITALIKEGKNNTIIRNPSLVITNAVGNYFGLVAEGIQIGEITEAWTTYTEELDRYQNDYRNLVSKQNELKEKEKLLYRDSKESTAEEKERNIIKIKEEIKKLQSNIENNAVTPLIKAGMYSNIIEDADTGQWKWDEELIKSMNITPERANYLKEFFVSESGDAYKTMADMTRKGDFIPRVILYYHLINKKGMKKIEALDEVRDRFVNYSTPLFSDTARLLDRTGIAMYLKYRLAIQLQAFKAFKNAPATAGAIIGAQVAMEASGYHTPFTVSSFLGENLLFGGNLPSGFWNLGTDVFGSVFRWKYLIP